MNIQLKKGIEKEHPWFRFFYSRAYLNGKLNKISSKILASSTRYLVKMILPFCHHCLQHAVIVTIKWHHWVVEFVFQSSITSYTLKHISYTIIFTKWLLHVLIHDLIYIYNHLYKITLHNLLVFLLQSQWNDNAFKLI